ncbi:MAG: hypothetical protein ABDH18_04245 [Aquificaceae bacterium]
MSYPKVVKALIVKNFPISKNIYVLELDPSEKIKPLPGQFLFLRIFQGFGESICRPFVFNYLDDKLVITYKIAGEGTFALSRLKPGDSLKALMPLGRSVFPLNPERVLLASGVRISALIGLKQNTNSELFFLKEDGDAEILNYFGLKANILKDKEELFDILNARKYRDFNLSIPLELAIELKKRFDIRGDIFIQTRMACGWGACYGCVIETISGYKRVCIDGPVFNIEEIRCLQV